ncbi:GNAT family N-acetyltransferase [Symbiopectobacterium purcellii]|uniref:GNAT family N-acetyltransferase n=1 Tax=Symbiopectobacterium purcellii TaxID=2871826 RepID=A0ABX9AVW1_9ENTR|nr:GNAT family N-acetyltransferase [Symbiopectobacterium purcellii]QZN97569.1 GNAT family N-acetyltransferase [Symbiopectobacterium purcellii]
MEMRQGSITVRSAGLADIQHVKALLERYHAKNLIADQRDNGFVTTDMTVEQLDTLRLAENGVTVAVDEGNNRVVGLLLGASWAFLQPWPMFDYMASILNAYTFNDHKLDPAHSYQYGPICIAEAYRGRGIGELLLAHQQQIFATRYPVVVTFVNVLNPRSYAFHSRNQFEDVGFFSFNGNNYHMMALPTC